MKTHNAESAAEFLNISADTLKDMAGSGAIPGAKIGKCWGFEEDDLAEYLRAEIRRQTAERRGHPAVKVPTAFQKSNTKRRPFKAPPIISMLK